MRLLLSSATGPIAAVLLLAVAPARAEPKPAWIDPPARSGIAKPDSAKSDNAKPDRAETDGAGTEDAGRTRAARSGTGTPAAAAPEPAADARSRRVAERRMRAARRGEGRLAATVRSEIDAGGREAGREAEPAAPARGADPRFSEWAGRAQRLAGDYLASVSASNGTTLSEAPRFYGERVRFHGRTMSTTALIAEKRRFVRRWPERRYEPKDGTMRTACDAGTATCVVRTVLGFQAANPRRGVRSLGVSELTLTVSFADERPVIVSETSRVLRRGAAAMSALDRPGNGA